jgi:hypothetical protein
MEPQYAGAVNGDGGCYRAGGAGNDVPVWEVSLAGSRVVGTTLRLVVRRRSVSMCRRRRAKQGFASEEHRVPLV